MKAPLIGIPDRDHDKVSYKLNQLLADEHVLYIKTKNFHWNVTGIHFKMLHNLFEEQYRQLDAMIDSLAERIRSIGHFAVGSLCAYTELARLMDNELITGESQAMVQTLLDDHETMIRLLRNLLYQDANTHDVGTLDLLTDLLKSHEKISWVLRSLLQ